MSVDQLNNDGPEAPIPETVCTYCGSAQKIDFKFCTACGKRNIISSQKNTHQENRFDFNIKFLGAYSILSLILLIASAFSDDSFDVLLIWSMCFAFIDIIFAFQMPKVWDLFIPKKFEFFPILQILMICTASAFVVTVIMGSLNDVLFEDQLEVSYIFNDLEYPLLFSIIVTAVFPAIFEELAFRGFVFSSLKELSGTTSAIWGSAFLFALVHFSLLSLVWLLPFGLFLAYFRNKYSTLLYGIIGHFTHNTMVILIEYYGWF